MARFMDALRKSGDSIGARIDVVASGVPPGLGEPVFDRLDADLAHALMSINAVKGVEIGAGFRVVEMRGTENRDEITPEGFVSNNAGGVLGGISSGQDIRASIALKPTSSLRLPGRSIDTAGNPVEVVTHGRHDPCVGIRATPIAEAMVAIVLMDHYLRHRGPERGGGVRGASGAALDGVNEIDAVCSAVYCAGCICVLERPSRSTCLPNPLPRLVGQPALMVATYFRDEQADVVIEIWFESCRKSHPRIHLVLSSQTESIQCHHLGDFLELIKKIGVVVWRTGEVVRHEVGLLHQSFSGAFVGDNISSGLTISSSLP